MITDYFHIIFNAHSKAPFKNDWSHESMSHGRRHRLIMLSKDPSFVKTYVICDHFMMYSFRLTFVIIDSHNIHKGPGVLDGPTTDSRLIISWFGEPRQPLQILLRARHIPIKNESTVGSSA
jgi:hypothetical protein